MDDLLRTARPLIRLSELTNDDISSRRRCAPMTTVGNHLETKRSDARAKCKFRFREPCRRCVDGATVGWASSFRRQADRRRDIRPLASGHRLGGVLGCRNKTTSGAGVKSGTEIKAVNEIKQLGRHCANNRNIAATIRACQKRNSELAKENDIPSLRSSLLTIPVE